MLLSCENHGFNGACSRNISIWTKWHTDRLTTEQLIGLLRSIRTNKLMKLHAKQHNFTQRGTNKTSSRTLKIELIIILNWNSELNFQWTIKGSCLTLICPPAGEYEAGPSVCFLSVTTVYPPAVSEGVHLQFRLMDHSDYVTLLLTAQKKVMVHVPSLYISDTLFNNRHVPSVWRYMHLSHCKGGSFINNWVLPFSSGGKINVVDLQPLCFSFNFTRDF